MDDRLTTYFVRDGARHLKFQGVLLGEASSADGVKDRWIEIRIYQTSAGRYVVERIGRTTIAGEQNRYNAQVSETVAGVLESLYLVDDDGVHYLTGVARQVLEAAGQHDADIQSAYMLEVID